MLIAKHNELYIQAHIIEMRFTKLLLVFLLLLSQEAWSQICTKSQLPANLQNGLVAFYPFCGNANDVSGNGNNGTVNGASLGTDRFGNVNSAYNFNKSTIDNIDVTQATSLNNCNNITISLWFKIYSYGAPGQSGYNQFINKVTSTNTDYQFVLSANTTGLYFYYAKGSFFQTTTKPSLNEWHHLVLTYSYGSINECKFYVDGILTNTFTTTQLLVSNTGNVTIGSLGSELIDFNTVDGQMDDILIINRAISACEVTQLFNSTNVSFPQLIGPIFHSFSDTTKICGTSVSLDPGAGFSSYSWNTGATTQTITPTTSGWYKVDVTNDVGCQSSDSTYLSIVNANIIQGDVTICKGDSIKLSVDSSFSGSISCNPLTLPPSLQNGLVAYFPFCGNANDATGNGNNGIVYGAQLTADRFGNSNAAYSFNGVDQYIQSASISKSITDKTYSAWVKLSTLNQGWGGLLGLQSSDGQIFDVVVYNETDNGWGFGSDNRSRSVWSGVKETELEWAMITATYSQNSYKFFRNGILIGTTTQFAITNFNSSSKINIGYRHDGGSFLPYLNGIIDDAFVFDRVLTQEEIKLLYNSTSVSWSTGSSSNSITVSPTQTTKYFVTVSDGITSCRDSVTVTVSDLSSFNSLQDTTSICGASTTLEAGSGFASYTWSTGATTQTIAPTSSGWYKVTVAKDAVCQASDSTYLSLVQANIINSDTVICKGSIVTLKNSIENQCDYQTLAKFLGTNRIASVSLTSGTKGYFGTGFSPSINDFWEYNFLTDVWTRLPDYPGGSIHDPISFVYKGDPYIGLGEDGSPKGIWKFSVSTGLWSKLSDFPGAGRYNTSSFVIDDNLYIVGGFSKPLNSCLSEVWQYNFINNAWTQLSNFPGGSNRTSHAQVLNGKAYMVIGGQDNCSITGINQFWEFDPTINNWTKKSDYPAKNPHVYSKVSYTENGRIVFGMGYNEPNFYSYDPNTNTWDSLSCSYAGSRDPIFFRFNNKVYLGSGIDDLNTNNYIDQFVSFSPKRIKTITWSTNETTDSIKVSPTQTAKYFVTVSDGITSCRDSVTVTVSDLSSFNPLQDTTSICGAPTTLDAGSGFASYSWNTGATTQTITPTTIGWFKVDVTNDVGCQSSDSTYLSLVQANILNRDTTICKGASIRLSVDSGSFFSNDLLAYYPFSGSTNDFSGNNRHAVNNGAVLTTDRFGNSNSAYLFNGSSSNIKTIDSYFDNGFTNYTISLWFNSERATSPVFGGQTFINTDPHNGLGFGYSYNGSQRIYHFKNSRINGLGGLNGSGWDILKNDNFNFTPVSLNTWHHVVIVKSALEYRYYINGQLDKTIPTSTTPISSYAGLIFGAISGPGEFFKGKLDDFLIWKRSLSSTEILALYQANNVNNINTTISWSTGATTNSVVVSPTQNTKYYVTVSDGITSCRDSATVTVASLDTSIAALDATTICSSGGNVRLQAGVADEYQWLKDGVVIPNADKRIYAATQTGSYRVVVRNTAGCTDTSRAISVTLDSNPSVNFTINTASQCLTGNSFVYTNTSSISSGTMTYAWTLGDGGTATTSNASKIYTAAGTYSVKLVATSNKLCKDSITKQLTVYAQPAVPVIAGSDEYCDGDSITLSTNASATRSWYYNTALISRASGSSLVIKEPGDYTVTTRDGNSCSSTSVIKKITENPLPVGVLNTPSSLYICEGTVFTLTASGGNSYEWYLDNTKLANENASSISTEKPGSYKVRFFSEKGCSIMSTNGVSLTLIKRPEAAFSYDAYCVDVPTNFSSRSITNSSGTVGSSWNFGDENIAGNVSNISHTYLQAGSFTARLVVTPLNCPQLADTFRQIIAVQSPIPGNAYPPVNAIINKPQQLNARAIGINYLWSPGIYLNSISSRTPMVTSSQEQLYRIAITNLAGCTTVDTQLVRVFNDRNIYVPEGFSPDNDGRNDRLAPILVGINEMKVFRIYNRWGLLVYDNKNANAYNGWDGTYKGAKQPIETYAWVAEGIDVDGQYIRRTGNTILIR